MKLNTLKAVADALAHIQERKVISHDNGTFGRMFECYFWTHELTKDKTRQELEVAAAKYQLLGKSDQLKEVAHKIQELPLPPVNMVFKLVSPITMLQGTKVISYQGKPYPVKMENVEYIYIPQDIVNGDFTSYVETGSMSSDMAGNDQPIIKLTLDRCILDVKEGARNNKGEVWRLPRAYVTAISFRSMQVAGSMMNTQRNTLNKLYGSVATEEFNAMLAQI